MKNKTPNQKISFHISGMHCASCAANIQRTLNKNESVDATVNYANEQATVSFNEDSISTKEIAKKVKSLGYTAQINQDDPYGKSSNTSHGFDVDLAETERKKEVKSLKNKLIISSFFTTLLMIGTMVPWAPDFLKNPWTMLLLATPVQFWVGGRYYKSALAALKNKTTNMDTLIALGTSVAYFYSLIVLILGWQLGAEQLMEIGIPAHVYFETSATIITLVLLGKYFELRAKGQTSEAIKKLLQLQAKTAHVKRNGKFIDVPVEKLVVGDFLQVKPGEKIPVDGVMSKGASAIDESR